MIEIPLSANINDYDPSALKTMELNAIDFSGSGFLKRTCFVVKNDFDIIFHDGKYVQNII